MKRDSTCMEGERGRALCGRCRPRLRGPGAAAPPPVPSRGRPVPASGARTGECGTAARRSRAGFSLSCLSLPFHGSRGRAAQPCAASSIMQLKKK